MWHGWWGSRSCRWVFRTVVDATAAGKRRTELDAGELVGAVVGSASSSILGAVLCLAARPAYRRARRSLPLPHRQEYRGRGVPRPRPPGSRGWSVAGLSHPCRITGGLPDSCGARLRLRRALSPESHRIEQIGHRPGATGFGIHRAKPRPGPASCLVHGDRSSRMAGNRSWNAPRRSDSDEGIAGHLDAAAHRLQHPGHRIVVTNGNPGLWFCRPVCIDHDRLASVPAWLMGRWMARSPETAASTDRADDEMVRTDEVAYVGGVR